MKMKNKNEQLLVSSKYPAIQRDLPFAPQPVSWWVDWINNHMLDLIHMLQWQKYPIEQHDCAIYYEVSYDTQGNINGFTPIGETNE